MCSNPLQKDGVVFGCGRCNQCIGLRYSDWVARAMMERATSENVFACTLTYNSEPQNEAAAQMFRYSDIVLFMVRLRRAMTYKFGYSAVRFIVAGEEGSRRGRVHWHMILFANGSILSLGKWQAPWGPVSLPSEIITPPGSKGRNREWSLWPHGFVVVQEPDEAGVRYALKYALKDQFRVDKSEGTARIAKAEALASGLFRMSKRPAIGMAYVDQRLASLAERGQVWPQIDAIRGIPGFEGYWLPRGLMREHILKSLRVINDDVRLSSGHDAPQWRSLLASLDGRQRDLEFLVDDKENEEGAEFSVQKLIAGQLGEKRKQQIRRQCYCAAPCDACLSGFDRAGLASAGIEEVGDEGSRNFRFIGEETGEGLRQKQCERVGSKPNRHCLLKDTPSRIKAAF